MKKYLAEMGEVKGKKEGEMSEWEREMREGKTVEDRRDSR